MTSIDGERAPTSEAAGAPEAPANPPEPAEAEPRLDAAAPSRAASSVRSPRLSARAQRSLLGALVLLFFFAFLSGRVAVPALLGWRSGLEAWISRSDDAAALLGQLTVVAGCLVAIQLLIAILVESDLSVGYRLIAAPTTAGIVTLVMAASTRELPLLLVIGLATLASFAALAASVPTVIEKHTRATGMVIGIAGLNSLLSVSARSLAVWASHEALTRLFRVAQVLATVAWVLDLVTLGIAIVWLTERRWKRALLVWGPVVALAIGLAIVSLYMTPRPDSVLGLLDKAVPVFLRHPWPVVPTLLHFALCLLLFFAVPAALFGRRQHPYAQSAVALALLARSGTDIPVLGLALLLASLLAALAAVRERPDAAAPLPQRPSQ